MNLGLIFSLLLLVSFSQAENLSCSKILLTQVEKFEVEWGRPLRLRLPFTGIDSKIYVLGEGLMGGTVYRIEEANTQQYVLKKYKSPLNMKLDLERLKLLNYLLSRQSENVESFRVVQAYPTNGNWMKLNFVEGQTLENLLSDKLNLSAKDKKVLESKYEMAFRDLQNRLRNAGILISTLESGFRVLNPFTKEISEILIHPGNIIVSPINFQLTIIDPY